MTDNQQSFPDARLAIMREDERISLSIRDEQGGELLSIHRDGTVTGSVEHATEAGAVLVAYLRQHLNDLAHTPTDDEREALTRIEDFALNEGVVFSGGPAGSWLPVDKLLDILGEREPQSEPSDAHLRGRWSNGDPVHIITDGVDRWVAPNHNGATWIEDQA